MKNCKGCENIKDRNFPFSTNKWGNPAIDTEGCGIGIDDDDLLMIKYCPVCGKKL